MHGTDPLLQQELLRDLHQYENILDEGDAMDYELAKDATRIRAKADDVKVRKQCTKDCFGRGRGANSWWYRVLDEKYNFIQVV